MVAEIFSLEAEQSVLGGLMLDNEALADIGDVLRPGDFYRADHRAIYSAILSLSARREPFDPVTLSEALEVAGRLDEAGGLPYLAALSRDTPSAANVRSYARIVRDKAARRDLMAIGNQITREAGGDGDVSQLRDRAQSALLAADERAGIKGLTAIKDVLRQVIDEIDRRFNSDDPLTGISTGFSDLDSVLGGLGPGTLNVLAGSPGAGKSTLASNISEHIAVRLRRPVLYWSGEMGACQVIKRSLSSLGRIDRGRIRSGRLQDEDWPKLTNATSLLSQSTFYVDDSPGLTVADLRSRAVRLRRQSGDLGMVVVDYLQRMTGPGETRAREVGAISAGLKALALELQVPIIAVASLNRSLEQRTDRRPMMSDLRESGDIEFDADSIAFVYRHEVFNPGQDEGWAEIIFRKNREGDCKTVAMRFCGQYGRFEQAVGAPGSWISPAKKQPRGFDA